MSSAEQTLGPRDFDAALAERALECGLHLLPARGARQLGVDVYRFAREVLRCPECRKLAARKTGLLPTCECGSRCGAVIETIEVEVPAEWRASDQQRIDFIMLGLTRP